MLPASIFSTLLLLLLQATASNQPLGVLHIKIVLADSNGKATPVPHHVLLVSDNPASAPPRRVVTALDGTAELRLAPGNYTVESDRPIALAGKTYQWMQVVDVRAGRDAVLELTAGNAEVESATSATAASGISSDADPVRASDAMAGQRRRAVDPYDARVRIRDRCEGTDRDEPAWGRHCHFDRGAAGASRQTGGERPAGRCRA